MESEWRGQRAQGLTGTCPHFPDLSGTSFLVCKSGNNCSSLKDEVEGSDREDFSLVLGPERRPREKGQLLLGASGSCSPTSHTRVCHSGESVHACARPARHPQAHAPSPRHACWLHVPMNRFPLPRSSLPRHRRACQPLAFVSLIKCHPLDEVRPFLSHVPWHFQSFTLPRTFKHH